LKYFQFEPLWASLIETALRMPGGLFKGNFDNKEGVSVTISSTVELKAAQMMRALAWAPF
jgi:hypothetical protein